MEEEQSSSGGTEKQDATDEQRPPSPPMPPQGATQQAGGTTIGTTAAAIRSYECNFCKRGFTNAQALGGHMNIHRKDKAKLKQSSTSTDPSTPQPQHFPPSPIFPPPPNMFQNNPGKWTFSTSPKDLTPDIHMTSKSITHEMKLADQNLLPPPLPPLPPAEEPPELDLELRLGHNTDQPPPSDQKGTRKFF